MALTSGGCLVIVILLVVLAGAYSPGYSHFSQFISELGATGAPHEHAVRMAGFLPAGVLLLVFCLLGLKALPASRAVFLSLLGLAVYAGGYLVAAAFPCDPGCRPEHPSTSQLIHNVGGLAGYFLAPVFLFVLARAARDWPSASRLSTAGFVAACVALVGVLTMSPESPFVGLSQRALEAAVLGWVAMLGIYVASQSTKVD